MKSVSAARMTSMYGCKTPRSFTGVTTEVQKRDGGLLTRRLVNQTSIGAARRSKRAQSNENVGALHMASFVVKHVLEAVEEVLAQIVARAERAGFRIHWSRIVS